MLRTCYTLVVDLLRTCRFMLWTCYELVVYVANLLWTCYGETGVMDFGQVTDYIYAGQSTLI